MSRPAKKIDQKRITKLVKFLREIEKLKSVKREIYFSDGTKENSAEHSWHVAMFGLLLTAEAEPKADLLKVLKMSLIHDLVEIYAGDTYLFDDKGRAKKQAKEYKAAKRLFSKLPADVAKEFWALFDEFEQLSTVEAQLVKSFDYLQPHTQNLESGGSTWKKRSITAIMHDEKKRPVMTHNPLMLEIYEALHKESVRRNLFAK